MKDRHWRTPYHFADLTVWGTSLDSPERRAHAHEVAPADIGLYLDDRWVPEADAIEPRFLDWRTLASPAAPAAAIETLSYVLGKLRAGATVEIGCFGGHGRTGATLASLEVLAGAAPGTAVARVRREYCRFGIGTPELAAFVHSVPSLAGALSETDQM
jgi:hypothetical protein